MAEMKLILYHTCQTHTETLDFQAHTSTKVPKTLAKTETLHLFSEVCPFPGHSTRATNTIISPTSPTSLDDCFTFLFCNAEEPFLLVYFPTSDSIPLC